MGVSIGEVEVAAPQATSRGGESSSGGGSGAAAVSPAELEAKILATIRRETARRERLWAD